MNTISITDLRQDATRVLRQVEASQEPTYVFQNANIKAVILDAKYYEALQEALEDFMDGLEAREALKEPGRITLDAYARKRWGKNYANLLNSKSAKRSRSSSK